MKKIIYRKNWTKFYKKYPESELSVKAAKIRHEKRKPYAVVIENGDDVRVIDSIFFPKRTYCIIMFLDELYRQYATYFFEEIEFNKQLFASVITFYYYRHPTVDSQRFADRSDYSPEGKVTAFYGDIIKEGSIDPTLLNFNYEPLPEFGDYDSLIRFERSLPPEQDTRKPGHLMIEPPHEPIDWS